MPQLKFKGAILDLDGVVTASAHLHSEAWKAMFDQFLEKWYAEHDKPFEPFTHEGDYLPYVDGKPRYEGVRSFLESRGIKLPYGKPKDEPSDRSFCGLGNRKNAAYQKLVEEQGAHVFDTSIALIRKMRAKGLKVAVASSSKNTQLILEKTGIEELFDTRVCGMVSEELGLKGKPDPDIFVKAAKDMGLEPCQCVMMEDAISGVTAGKGGNFGLVLGVARHVEREQLLAHGADLVVGDLGEISLDQINDWFLTGRAKDGWNHIYHGFVPEEEKLRECLCTVGNGYFGTRGCAEFESASDHHYPGTYIAGVYNKLPTDVHGRTIYNNDLVNCPNWLPVEFAVGQEDFVSPLAMEVLDYRQNLNMYDGVMERTFVCKDRTGRTTRIETRRIASMTEPHCGALQFSLTPLNYSARITFRSTLNGDLINDGVARYRQLNQEHLAPVDAQPTPGGTYVHVKTKTSNVDIVVSARVNVAVDGRPNSVQKAPVTGPGRVSEVFTVQAAEGQTVTLEKIAAIYTSNDAGSKDALAKAKKAIAREISFEEVFRAHAHAWHKLWAKMDMQIEGDRFAQKVSRLHAYHIVCTASPHNTEIDAGVPARGLHGEAYRGHIFWDEVYIFPFFNAHFPEITRALLMYRYRRLDAARKYARENRYQGAMYPWQTADDGDEETQIVHYNPVSGHWGPDLSRRQRHVSIAIFYNVWRYWERTGDTPFLEQYGAEMMLEIARFFASAAKYEEDTRRYHIEGVMGPDEYHEKYPGRPDEEGGIKDNAYTNILTVWLLEKTLEMLDRMPASVFKELVRKSGFDQSEIPKWHRIIRSMNVVFREHIISQFNGYRMLPELDWEKYRKKYPNIERMDRILKAEGDSPDKYKVSKQADTLMTFYLLQPEEVQRIMNQLGYAVDNGRKLLKDNYEYYVGRTSHGSTLSKVVHAAISKDIQSKEVTWEWFMQALRSDIYDTQGGTTLEGIHCGVMAGTLWVILRNFAGLTILGDTVSVSPALPEHWRRLKFSVLHRGVLHRIEITRERIHVGVDRKGKPFTAQIPKGQRKTFRPSAETRLEVDFRPRAKPAAFRRTNP